jgi:acyl carrier protein
VYAPIGSDTLAPLLTPRGRAPTVQARRPMATQEEVFEQVKGILSQQLGVDEDEVTIESSFQADLDADSLDLVELIMELEDQFGVKISDEEAQKIGTVGQAVDFVLAHQS